MATPKSYFSHFRCESPEFPLYIPYNLPKFPMIHLEVPGSARLRQESAENPPKSRNFRRRENAQISESIAGKFARP